MNNNFKELTGLKLQDHAIFEAALCFVYNGVNKMEASLFDSFTCKKRAEDILYAFRCYLTEEGTTTEQNELLKEIGIKL